MSEDRNPTTENGAVNGAPAEETTAEETTVSTTPVATLSAEADTPISPAVDDETVAGADEGVDQDTPRAEAEADEVAEEEVTPAVAVSAEAEEPVEAEEPEPVPEPTPAAPVAAPPAQATGPAPTQTAGPKEYTPEYEVGGRSRRIHIEVRLDEVNYKNVALLGRFLDPRGRILSRRKTRVSAKVQRRVVNAIKLARHVALLPYTSDQTRIVRRRR